MEQRSRLLISYCFQQAKREQGFGKKLAFSTFPRWH
jgi:hypothetical protein